MTAFLCFANHQLRTFFSLAFCINQGPLVLPSPRISLKMQNCGHSPVLLNQKLHFNMIPIYFIGALIFTKHFHMKFMKKYQ